MDHCILIVDDNPQNLNVLGELLCERYKVRAANSGRRALALALQDPPPDLVLLDVMMPDMSGYEVLAQMRVDPRTRDIPVIFTTAMNEVEDEERGLSLGAVDYITKPLRPAIVLARVRTHMDLKLARDLLRRDKGVLEIALAQRLRENQEIQDVSIRALARLAETRDNETGNHILRTQFYVHSLASAARTHPRFAGVLDDHAIELIAKSAPLHDIGKVGIPDHVLLKPGKLDAQEWEVMKTHARLGAEAIERAVADIHQPLRFLAYARDIALHHHERWDGTGYPDGLRGDDIPLAARLMSVADVFDALISQRVYKPAMSFEAARDIMRSQRGQHFDPDLLDLFLVHFEAFCVIAHRHPDHGNTVAV